MTFTIITCTYNAAALLPRTLDSVRTQTHSDLRHIIMDGASSDGTADIIKRYAREAVFPVTAVSEPDGGLYDAMNKALALAGGDYVIFLNAGDKFHSHDTLAAIAEQVTDADGELPGVVYGQTDIVDDEGHFKSKRHLQAPARLSWRSFRDGMLVCHQAFYARTDIARRTPYDLRYRLSADVDWCIRVMKEAEHMGLRLHYTSLTLCDYLDGGLSVKNHRASLMERFRVMSRHYGLFPTLLRHLAFLKRRFFP